MDPKLIRAVLKPRNIIKFPVVLVLRAIPMSILLIVMSAGRAAKWAFDCLHPVLPGYDL